MKTVIFLQSDTDNPYKIYAEMIEENPLFLDEANNCWAVYSYENCQAILADPNAQIPQPAQAGESGLNEYALLIAGRLVRSSNPPEHMFYRRAARMLAEKMKPVPPGPILDRLIGGWAEVDGVRGTAGMDKARGAAAADQSGGKRLIDWAGSAGKVLPAATILKGFDFSEEDIDEIVPEIQQLAGIMLPHKTASQVAAINETARKIYQVTEKTITASGLLKELTGSRPENHLPGEETISPDERISIYISNLIGLVIQSYDAGRGVLCNSLLQILLNAGTRGAHSDSFFYRSVVESLRFDPPVHNTKRIAKKDIFINGQTIVKGQTILVVLAAANRDPVKFRDPAQYDINRNNNEDHLTFGSGPHACVAKHFSTGLAAEALAWLFRKFPKIELTPHDIKYEPLVNARIPRELFISLGS